MISLQLHRAPDEPVKSFKSEQPATRVDQYQSEKASSEVKDNLQHDKIAQRHNEEPKAKGEEPKSFTDVLKESVNPKKRVPIKADEVVAKKITTKHDGKKIIADKDKKELKVAVKEEKSSKKEDAKADLSMLATMSVMVATEKPVAIKKSDEPTIKVAKLEKDSFKGAKNITLNDATKDEVKASEPVDSAKTASFTVKKDNADELKSEAKLEMKDDKAEGLLAIKNEAKPTKSDKPLAPIQKNQEPIVIVADRRSTEPVVQSTTLSPVQQSANLAQNLRESGNTEIVQRAQIILKEADSGEIRLTLKPENLGTVRISINLDDNRLLGRIIVDNNMVKAAFDDNMADLRDSMLKSGFDGADLDVTVGGKGTQERQQNQQKQTPTLAGNSTRTIAGENYFNSETISLVADTINGSRTLNVQA